MECNVSSVEQEEHVTLYTLHFIPQVLFVQLLNLMSQMLWDSASRHSASDQHFMLRRHGFVMLVFLLRQLHPPVWTVDAVTACVQLTSCFAANETLHHEAAWLLFGQPCLWIFTAVEVESRK